MTLVARFKERLAVMPCSSNYQTLTLGTLLKLIIIYFEVTEQYNQTVNDGVAHSMM